MSIFTLFRAIQRFFPVVNSQEQTDINDEWVDVSKMSECFLESMKNHRNIVTNEAGDEAGAEVGVEAGAGAEAEAEAENKALVNDRDEDGFVLVG